MTARIKITVTHLPPRFEEEGVTFRFYETDGCLRWYRDERMLCYRGQDNRVRPWPVWQNDVALAALK